MARDVVNVDEEQQWTRAVLFLVVLLRRRLPDLIFLLKLGHTDWGISTEL